MNGSPLLATLLTVTTMFPVVAPLGTTATIDVELQYVTEVAGVPLKVTVPCVDPKFEPLIVTEEPIRPEDVLRLLMSGAESTIVNVAPDDVPAESFTVRVTVPVVAIKLAGTAAINCVELTNVVVRAVLPHNTDAPEAKFVPFTASAKPALPAVTDVGNVLAMVGTPTENVEPVEELPEEEPSGFVTAMVIDPSLAARLDGTAACSSVELTNVVVKEVVLDCAFACTTEFPLEKAMFLSAVVPETELVLLVVLVHCTIAPGTKFVPLTVKVKPALPVGTELGEMPVTAGAEATAL